jgi:hypothetical protein
MPSTESDSPDETFFNDLSQQAQESNNANGQENQQDGPNKTKRIACVLCRKRKLRCDGTRPTCSTCKRLSHDCTYDEVRKKSGPKRGYVKLLEQRLRELAHTSLYYPSVLTRCLQNKSRLFSRARTRPSQVRMPHARTPPPHTSRTR